MKKILIIIAIVLVTWDAAWYLAGVHPLFPWQLKHRTGEYSLVDVRTPWEYNWFHIEGAANRPDLLFSQPSAIKEKIKKPVVIICMSGHRSALVVRQLKQQGATEIYNLTWGMLGWKIFGGKTAATPEIHQGRN